MTPLFFFLLWKILRRCKICYSKKEPSDIVVFFSTEIRRARLDYEEHLDLSNKNKCDESERYCISDKSRMYFSMSTRITSVEGNI